jgi:hypothetical protein
METEIRPGNETTSPGHNRSWEFLTNHALVLICVATNRDTRVREIAKEVGITERATQAILKDLDDDGYVSRVRYGRCNHYRINRRAFLQHPLVRSVTVGDLLDSVTPFPLQPLTAVAPRLVF